VVKALSGRRGPASEAVLLYEETAESRQWREALAEQRRLDSPAYAGRPTKQDRRRIVRFTRGMSNIPPPTPGADQNDSNRLMVGQVSMCTLILFVNFLIR